MKVIESLTFTSQNKPDFVLPNGLAHYAVLFDKPAIVHLLI